MSHAEIDKPEGTQPDIPIGREIDDVGQLRQSRKYNLPLNGLIWANSVIYRVKRGHGCVTPQTRSSRNSRRSFLPLDNSAYAGYPASSLLWPPQRKASCIESR